MKISSSCYAITGLSCITPWTVNAGFIVGQNTTLIVDTGANYQSALTIHGYGLCVSRNPIIVVNTERHFDHVGGNSYFSEQRIDIYGHYLINRTEDDLNSMADEINQCTLEVFRRDAKEEGMFFAETRVANPNKKIESDMNIDLGEIEAKVILTPGHTATNISIYVPDEGVLFCGDCIVNGYLPNLDSGTVEDWKIWTKYTP